MLHGEATNPRSRGSGTSIRRSNVTGITVRMLWVDKCKEEEKVPLTGLEPVVSALRGRRVNHLHYSGILNRRRTRNHHKTLSYRAPWSNIKNRLPSIHSPSGHCNIEQGRPESQFVRPSSLAQRRDRAEIYSQTQRALYVPALCGEVAFCGNDIDPFWNWMIKTLITRQHSS